MITGSSEEGWRDKRGKEKTEKSQQSNIGW